MNTYTLEDIYTNDTMESLAAEIVATQTTTLEEIHEHLDSITDENYGSIDLFDAVEKYAPAIVDNAAEWGVWATEELFGKFLTHEFATTKVRVSIFNLFFSAEFDGANLVAELLWDGDRDFAARLVLAVREADDPTDLFKAFGLNETPLAVALKAIVDIPAMSGRVAGEFVFKVLFDGLNAQDAYNAARNEIY